MITKAFIQREHHTLGHEEKVVADVLSSRDILIEYFNKKKLFRRRLDIRKDTLVVGTVEVIKSALKQLKIAFPAIDTYPISLRPFLYRKISEKTLGDVIEMICNCDLPEMFIKPKNNLKGFTGRIFSTTDDIQFFNNISRRTIVYCSEVVEWMSESRVYVVDGDVKDVQLYEDTDLTEMLDLNIVNDAITAYLSSKDHIKSFGIDFGVLRSKGQYKTALIEMNEGFALGCYDGCNPEVYTNMLLSRWEELCQNS